MQTQHTPGPWKVDTRIPNTNALTTITGSGRWVATVPRDLGTTTAQVYPGELEAQANAKLIAAAPDLLEAVLGIRHLAQYAQYAGRNPDIVKMCDTAIAKATELEDRP